MEPKTYLGRLVVPYCCTMVALAVISCGSSSDGGGGKGGSSGGGASGAGGGSAKAGASGKGGMSSSAGATSKGGESTSGGTGATTGEGGAAGDTIGDAGASTGGTGATGGTGSSGTTSTGEAGQGGEPGIPVNDLCANATPLLLGTTPSIDIKASTLGAGHEIDPPCASGAGPDVFYSFDISKRVFVYADTFGANWNTVLYLLTDACAPITTATTPGDATCSGSACGGAQSQIVALLDPGRYRLGLSGRGGAAGEATIHFQFAVAGSGSVTELPAGSSTQTGTTVGSSGNMQGLSPDCLAAGPENSYWWTSCPADPGGAFSASTCGGASWETVLALEIPATKPYTCSLDSCSLQASISSSIPAGAGVRVLAVDGQGGTDKGAYSMTVSRP